MNFEEFKKIETYFYEHRTNPEYLKNHTEFFPKTSSTLKKLPSKYSWYGDVFKQRQKLFQEGTLVFGFCLLGNPLLFDPKVELDAPAYFIYSTEEQTEEHLSELNRVFNELQEIINDDDFNPNEYEDKEFFEPFTDHSLPIQNVKLPKSLTNENIYVSTFLVERKALLGNSLEQLAYPLLIHKDIKGATILHYNSCDEYSDLFISDEYNEAEPKSKSGLLVGIVCFVLLVLFKAYIRLS